VFNKQNTKIGDLDIEVFVKKQVFRLQVSVYDHVPMTVVNAGYDLLEKPSCSRLLQLRSRHSLHCCNKC